MLLDDPHLEIFAQQLARDTLATTAELATKDGKVRMREARNDLVRIYHEAKKAGRLAELPLPIRSAIDDLRFANGGTLPVAKPGNRARDRSFPLAVAVALLKQTDPTMPIVKALIVVGSEGGASYQSVSAAHYRWQYSVALRAELAGRQLTAARLTDAGQAEEAARWVCWRDVLKRQERVAKRTRRPRTASSLRGTMIRNTERAL